MLNAAQKLTNELNAFPPKKRERYALEMLRLLSELENETPGVEAAIRIQLSGKLRALADRLKPYPPVEQVIWLQSFLSEMTDHPVCLGETEIKALAKDAALLKEHAEKVALELNDLFHEQDAYNQGLFLADFQEMLDGGEEWEDILDSNQMSAALNNIDESVRAKRAAGDVYLSAERKPGQWNCAFLN